MQKIKFHVHFLLLLLTCINRFNHNQSLSEMDPSLKTEKVGHIGFLFFGLGRIVTTFPAHFVGYIFKACPLLKKPTHIAHAMLKKHFRFSRLICPKNMVQQTKNDAGFLLSKRRKNLTKKKGVKNIQEPSVCKDQTSIMDFPTRLSYSYLVCAT